MGTVAASNEVPMAYPVMQQTAQPVQQTAQPMMQQPMQVVQQPMAQPNQIQPVQMV